MKNLFFKIFIIGSLIIFFFLSCKKEESNLSPTCKITSPINSQEIGNGEVVTITVDANDIDGSITRVRFFVNGTEIGSSTNYPYSQNWEPNSENLGAYIISVIVNDNSGGSASYEITVILVDGELFGAFTDPRDGQSYSTVQIGNQRWFSQNLNYETPNSWCYENSDENCDDLGRLYSWDDALTVCPEGWHLPSDDEWKVLEMELGMSQSEVDKVGYRGTNEGEKLKYTYGWHNNGNGTNSSGFKGLPAGFFWYVDSDTGMYFHLEKGAYFISSTIYKKEGNLVLYWYRLLDYNYKSVYRKYMITTDGLSVRCLKD